LTLGIWPKYLVMGLLAVAAVCAADENAVQARIDSDREMLRELNARSPSKSSTPIFDKLDDDGTTSARTPAHQPTKEALKLAEKAEKEAGRNQHEKSAEYLSAALTADPDFVEAENNLALDLLALKRPEEAIAHLRHMVATHPERVFTFNSLGVVLCDLRRYPEAETVARESMKLHPLSFTTNLILGLSLAAQGKFTKESKQALQFASAQRPEANALLKQWPLRR
jgi:tetratricopeptide (TPR) repeat protein